jgi:hypothetical protein
LSWHRRPLSLAIIPALAVLLDAPRPLRSEALLSGAQPLESFARVLDRELARAR